MDVQRKQWIVLARIPDLNAAGADGAADGETGGALSASAGRLIKQALSFKLLVGTALFLLAVAVFAVGKKAPPTDPAATWPSDPAPVAADASPTDTVPSTPVVASRPPAMIPATTEPARAPAIIPPPSIVKDTPQPSPAVDQPRMSSWPNPLKR
jgi:hypothetical protein